MKDKSPCDGCVPPERQPGCQDRCTRGIAYRAKMQERNGRIRQAREQEMIIDNFKVGQIAKSKKMAGLV